MGIKLPAKLEAVPNEVYAKTELTSCPEYKEWYKNWLYQDSDLIWYAYEPDNTCISKGTLLEACIALNNSTYGN